MILPTMSLSVQNLIFQILTHLLTLSHFPTTTMSTLNAIIAPSFMQQSLSAIANHDPLLRSPVTPTKRQTPQGCDDEALSSQISPAQFSSNKLAKHVKIE